MNQTLEKNMAQVCGEFKLKLRTDVRMNGDHPSYSMVALTHDNEEYAKSDFKPTEGQAEEELRSKVLVLGKPLSIAEMAARSVELQKKLDELEKKVKK